MSKDQALQKDKGAKLVRKGNQYAVQFTGGASTPFYASGVLAWEKAAEMLTALVYHRKPAHAVRVARVR